MKHTPEEIKNRLSNIGEAIGDVALEYIADLEKENAELKTIVRNTKAVDESFALQTIQLTNAKDLIELLLSDNRIMKAQFESEEQANIWFEHIHQAEQFLKENK